MSSSRSLRGSTLGDSWVVNKSDSSDADINDESSPEPLAEHAPEVSPRKTKSSRKAAALQSSQPHNARRINSRASSHAPEPELIMPSINENVGYDTRRSHDTHSTTYSEPRKRNVRHTTKPNGQAYGRGATQTSFSKIARGEPSASTSEIGTYLLDFLGHAGSWLLDILGGTLKALRKPITWVLTIYVFAGLFTLMQNLLSSTIYTALSPLCRLPGATLLNLPMCQFSTETAAVDPSAPVEFDRLMAVQSKFEDVLEQTTQGLSLPMDMKRGETAVRDLRQVVIYSTLRSKNELLLEFDGFIETARIASYDMMKFNAHVGRAVDMTLSTARWTQRVLDDMAIQQSVHASRGVIPAFISDKLLAPFQPLQFTEDKLLDQYIKHTSAVSDEIERLLSEAESLLQTLKNLEDRLDVMHGIALRDNIHAQGSKDDLLSELWTVLGGNRKKLARWDSQLKLLGQVGEHRKIAWAHVSGAILKLQAMGAQVEELRERVGSAEMLKDHPEVPLAVHIETIRLGVERLQQGRENAREIESRHLRKVMDRAEEGQQTFVLDSGFERER